MQTIGLRFVAASAVSLFLLALNGQALAESVEARLHWYKRVELGTAVSGVVKAVHVSPGDRVKQGTPLVELDPEVFRARVAQARAHLASQQEAYAEARRERDRALELYDRTVLSEHDLQMAKNAFVRAEAALEQARAQLVTAQTELKYSAVTAPFNGIVLQRLAEPGKVVSAELTPMTMVVLAEADHMLARAHLTQSQLQNLSVGQPVQVRPPGGSSLAGQVHVIGLEPVDDSEPLRYAVDVLFTPGARVLRVGEQVELILP